ncbi:hypothetical protein JCM6882_009218 [Rhodosporidiobolus microsporus]
MLAPVSPPASLASALGFFISDEDLLSLANDDQMFWRRHVREGAHVEVQHAPVPQKKGGRRQKKTSEPPKRVVAARILPPLCGLSPTEAKGEFFLAEEESPPAAALSVPPSLLSEPPTPRRPIPSFRQPSPPSSPILIPVNKRLSPSRSPTSSPTLWQLDQPRSCEEPFPLSLDAPHLHPIFLPPEEPLSDSPRSFSTVSSSVPTLPPSSPHLPLNSHGAPLARQARKLPYPPPLPPPLPPLPVRPPLDLSALVQKPDDSLRSRNDGRAKAGRGKRGGNRGGNTTAVEAAKGQ